jgi:hypothetical protein
MSHESHVKKIRHGVEDVGLGGHLHDDGNENRRAELLEQDICDGLKDGIRHKEYCERGVVRGDREAQVLR